MVTVLDDGGVKLGLFVEKVQVIVCATAGALIVNDRDAKDPIVNASEVGVVVAGEQLTARLVAMVGATDGATTIDGLV